MWKLSNQLALTQPLVNYSSISNSARFWRVEPVSGFSYGSRYTFSVFYELDGIRQYQELKTTYLSPSGEIIDLQDWITEIKGLAIKRVTLDENINEVFNIYYFEGSMSKKGISFNPSDIINGGLQVNHNLNSRYISAFLLDDGGYQWEVDFQTLNSNSIKVDLNDFDLNGSFEIFVRVI